MILLNLVTLFVFAYFSTDPIRYLDNNYIYDISFNTRYDIDVKYYEAYDPIYKCYYMPANKRYIFRMTALANDNLEVECYVYKGATISFYVDVCAYVATPNEDTIKSSIVLKNKESPSHYCEYTLQGTRSNYDQNYDVLSYKFTTGDNLTYLGVGVMNSMSLHYLGVKVYSEKGMTIAIILLIILLPVILVVGLVVFLLRKCGCIVTISSSSI